MDFVNTVDVGEDGALFGRSMYCPSYLAQLPQALPFKGLLGRYRFAGLCRAWLFFFWGGGGGGGRGRGVGRSGFAASFYL